MKAMYILCVAGMARDIEVGAAPADYTIDPHHTYPSFEADHMGISLWRGKFNKSSGWVKLDKVTGSGTLEIIVEVGSIDFDHDKLIVWAVGPDFFDVKTHPVATYRGSIEPGPGGNPARITGDLTLHGVTRALPLIIHHFKCLEHPLLKRDYCGADVSGLMRRDEFGQEAGKPYGLSMDVNLRIQVEALKND